ncbi:hypothetical protein KP509_1Z003600 [Ceratopteris richardii]|nr:hypothetical protein KP509_1Z003600 [Ceratopteris richardii]
MSIQKDVVSWNDLRGGYMQHDLVEDVLGCYTDMPLDGVIPDAVSFFYALKACGMLMAIYKVVDMYGKCGFLDKAKKVFDIFLMKNVVTWNALVGGFSQYERDEEALKLVEDMPLHGVIPNAVTYTCALKACGNLGAGDKGSEIHREITKQRAVESTCKSQVSCQYEEKEGLEFIPHLTKLLVLVFWQKKKNKDSGRFPFCAKKAAVFLYLQRKVEGGPRPCSNTSFFFVFCSAPEVVGTLEELGDRRKEGYISSNDREEGLFFMIFYLWKELWFGGLGRCLLGVLCAV